MVHAARLLGVGVVLAVGVTVTACTGEDQTEVVSRAGAGGAAGGWSAGTSAGTAQGGAGDSADACESELIRDDLDCVKERCTATRVEPCRYRIAVPDSVGDSYDPLLVQVVLRGEDGASRFLCRGTGDCCESHGWFWEGLESDSPEIVLCERCCEYFEQGDLEFYYGCLGPVSPVIC